MSTNKSQTALQGLMHVSPMRQVGLMVGIAISVALGVGVVLWAQKPDFKYLYNGNNGKDSTKVAEILQGSGINYQIDNNTGAILVEAKKYYLAKMKLASDGISSQGIKGNEILENTQKFGVSHSIQTARLRQALEGELSRTLSRFNNVKGARVHLAVPRASLFVNDSVAPRASVFLTLYPGRRISSDEARAISQMVASSVPNLKSGNVTVVDQNGRLLNHEADDPETVILNKQFSYTRKLEKTYAKRIEEILIPIVGPGKIKARVAVDVDYTKSEQTRESYNPDLLAVRSEQVIEENRGGARSVSGVPGTESKIPSRNSSGITNGSDGSDQTGSSGHNGKRKSKITRNYELDRTVSHIATPFGRIKRLTVAVVVDDKDQINKRSGAIKKIPLKKEEVASIIRLVKDAIGFDAERGDRVEVVNTRFATLPTAKPLPEPPLWKQSWFIQLLKQIIGGVVVILLIFGVLKPLINNLIDKNKANEKLVAELSEVIRENEPVSEASGINASVKPGAANYEQQMQAIKDLAKNDPKRVAQVMSSWVGEE